MTREDEKVHTNADKVNEDSRRSIIRGRYKEMHEHETAMEHQRDCCKVGDRSRGGKEEAQGGIDGVELELSHAAKDEVEQGMVVEVDLDEKGKDLASKRSQHCRLGIAREDQTHGIVKRAQQV